MFSTPVFLADSTSALLVSASILPLAVLTSPATVCFKVSFSSAVKLELSIAASLVLAASSMALYRLVKHALPELAMIEYSRFTQRIKQLGPVLQAIRQGLLSWINPGSIAIIDSYPLPLCQYVRNFHTCSFAVRHHSS